MHGNAKEKKSKRSTANAVNGEQLMSSGVDHQAMVAAGIQQLGLIEFFDHKMPKEGTHRVSHGQAIAAMILIGLGFANRRLYLISEIFKGVRVEQLIGKGLKAEDFTDDLIGRSLDAIFEAGPTELFLQWMLNIVVDISRQCTQRECECRSSQGQHEETLKAERPDLKKILLCLLTNKDGIPAYFKTLSGNTSAKESFFNAMKKTITAIQENLSEDREALYIADSAFYTEKNVQFMGNNNLFISLAPSTLAFVQEMQEGNILFEPTSDAQYALHLKKIDYAGIQQTLVVVSSQKLKERALNAFERETKKEKEIANNNLRKLSSVGYSCAADASEGLKKWSLQNPLFIPTLHHIAEKRRRPDGLRGEPNAQTTVQALYHVHATLAFNQEELQRRKSCLGRFVLITNDLSLDAEMILASYKQQSEVEKGFRLLKDPNFLIDDIFIRNHKRILALNMLMALTLIVYNLLDRDLIPNLKAK